ncbi:hypothetical protein [Mycoplana dimorpha]|uniref:Uncharacterized protein n=1 Tax=Mycoplana dimorpha TaxID=28320 RepID=A0A2T5BE84_MYCDI|nr:hypothetical protein [Mycoplana dimorpha]PTM97309.1 hypothetical protein C7449_102179 [Mycoplana dimorpha]
MTASLFGRAALHHALDKLLDTGEEDNGRLNPDAFWDFAGMLAAGRGITEGLHDAGLKAVRAVPDSPRNTFNDRQRRAYHLGLLDALLLSMGRSEGQGLMPSELGSLLPGNFRQAAIVHDLRVMLGGSDGMGAGHPQILFSARDGNAALRGAACRQLVGVIRWRMGRTGATRNAVWHDLMGTRREIASLNRWQKEAGGTGGELYTEAFAAGQAGVMDIPWAKSNEELVHIIALALGRPGSRNRD